MPTILSDHDVEGQLEYLLVIWTSEPWRELWQGIGGSVESFRSLGLRHDMPDSELWLFCQEHQLVLVTGNRNADTENSLERTSERLNRPDSLPILTIADPDRVMVDRQYAESVASRALDFIFDLDTVRGARRLYVP